VLATGNNTHSAELLLGTGGGKFIFCAGHPLQRLWPARFFGPGGEGKKEKGIARSGDFPFRGGQGWAGAWLLWKGAWLAHGSILGPFREFGAAGGRGEKRDEGKKVFKEERRRFSFRWKISRGRKGARFLPDCWECRQVRRGGGLGRAFGRPARPGRKKKKQKKEPKKMRPPPYFSNRFRARLSFGHVCGPAFGNARDALRPEALAASVRWGRGGRRTRGKASGASKPRDGGQVTGARFGTGRVGWIGLGGSGRWHFERNSRWNRPPWRRPHRGQLGGPRRRPQGNHQLGCGTGNK